MELKFNKATDTEHEIKLDSQLIYAAWRTGTAYGGQAAPLEVLTSFVGNGAKIKIEGKSENGKNLGKINSKIKNNKFIGELEIPEDIELGDSVYFEVNLSDNGLDGESNRIPAKPPIKVTNMKWSAEEARRGDTLTLTADIEGVDEGTEAKIIIYEYDNDNIHDVITEFPAVVEKNKIEVMWEYEYHEDTDEIPTEEEMQKYGGKYNPPEYFFTITIGAEEFGKEQESGILEFKDWIEINLKDENDEIIPNEEYVLICSDGVEKRGSVDESGYAREKGIPPGRIKIEFPNLKDQKESDNQSQGQRSQT